MVVSGAAGRRTAQRLAGSRATIIDNYESALRRMGSVLLVDPLVREQCLAQAGNILTDVCSALRDATDLLDPATYRQEIVDLALSREIGANRASSGIHPVESLRAASALLEVLLAGVAVAVGPEEDGVAMMAIATRAAYHSIMTRIREAASSYSSFLLNKIHQAHVEERARIGRELHDRLGSGISAAARAVELLRTQVGRDPVLADMKIAQAEEVLRAAVEETRRIARDLRLHTHTEGLEKALLRSVDAICPESTQTFVEVIGDESWASPAVLDELFLALREAMRNAYSHARARNVVIHVEIAPHELRAAVADDGVGFDPECPTEGMGLVAMRERVALMAGVVNVFSRPGRGTSVEARIPLAGVSHGG
jgi:signal transduction histidine kinase